MGQGLAEGATSLVSHTIGGTFSSVSKITGSISSGLAVLCFDK
jgi:vacuolar protein sorting-associated protein 13A/C